MAEYKSEEFDARITVADKPTVRQILRYRSEIVYGSGREHNERLWSAAQSLITEWDCDIPQDVDLDDVEGLELDKILRIANVVQWTGIQVFNHYQGFEVTPKN